MALPRKHNYIIGFKGENRCLYGKDQRNIHGILTADYIQPMTIYQAIQQLKTLSKGEKVIYKFVKIDPSKEKLKAKIISQMVKKD